MDKKLSLSIRVDSFTSAHVYVSVFLNMVLVEYTHDQVTRAKSGDLVLRVEEFNPFIQHIKPHKISCLDIDQNEFFKLVGVNYFD